MILYVCIYNSFAYTFCIYIYVYVFVCLCIVSGGSYTFSLYYFNDYNTKYITILCYYSNDSLKVTSVSTGNK